jgi:myosin-5
LENKVVELTQTLQKRTLENKELRTKLRTLDSQLLSWISKYDEADTKVKALSLESQKPTIALPEFEALDLQKRELDSKLEISLKKIIDQDAQIAKLSEASEKQLVEIESRHVAFAELVASGTEDASTVTALRTELSSLREQLTRQVATTSMMKSNTERPEGGAFNMATGRGGAANGAMASPSPAVAGGSHSGAKRRQRRHSDTSPDHGNGNDEELWESPRAISADIPRDMVRRLPNGTKGYLPEIFDDPAEEIMRLLEDEEPLDADVLMGIIRLLKIPAPSAEHPPSPKEVLFPAHLISLVTNEMWKYGMMRESERFLANVMQTVQQHVMVRGDSI